MRKFDEIRDMFIIKIRREKKRLKSYGTKIDSFQIANVVASFSQALQAESRYSELKRLLKFCRKKKIFPTSELSSYLQERVRATKQMSEAIEHSAEHNEKNRPWKRTVKKENIRKGATHK